MLIIDKNIPRGPDQNWGFKVIGELGEWGVGVGLKGRDICPCWYSAFLCAPCAHSNRLSLPICHPLLQSLSLRGYRFCGPSGIPRSLHFPNRHCESELSCILHDCQHRGTEISSATTVSEHIRRPRGDGEAPREEFGPSGFLSCLRKAVPSAFSASSHKL